MKPLLLLQSLIPSSRHLSLASSGWSRLRAQSLVPFSVMIPVSVSYSKPSQRHQKRLVLTNTVSAVLVYLGKDLDNRLMNNQEKEAITSLCSGGAFFGAILAGLYADRFGRKTGIYIGCVLFTVGALIQAASYSFAQMCVGRLVVGFGVGSAAMIAPLYIAEIAPTKYRGRMIVSTSTAGMKSVADKLRVSTT